MPRTPLQLSAATRGLGAAASSWSSRTCKVLTPVLLVGVLGVSVFGPGSTPGSTAVSVPALRLAADTTPPPPQAGCSGDTCTVTYHESLYGERPFTVPLGVTSLQVSMLGASGGSYDNTYGGAGAAVDATLTVTPGQALTVAVGLAGKFQSDRLQHVEGFTNQDNSAGWFQTKGGHGAGGGGASSVSSAGAPLLVAGGGGGAGGSTLSYPCFSQDFPGGNGGDSGLTGADGGRGISEDSSPDYVYYGGGGGGGATATSNGGGGGPGGVYVGRLSGDQMLTDCMQYASNGTGGDRGNGRIGGSGRLSLVEAGGGGGSGYLGGGAGGSGGRDTQTYSSASAGGGGGGSSYVDPASVTASSVRTGPNNSCRSQSCGTDGGSDDTGNGVVVLTFTRPAGDSAPAAPTNVQAVPGDTTATVSFTPGDDGGQPVSGYYVRAFDETTGESGDVPVAASSPATVTGLHNGHAYHFTVAAGNILGVSPVSAASNTVVPAQAPGAPTNVTAAPAYGAADVSFAPPASDGYRPITGYTVTATNLTNTGQAPVTTTGTTSPIHVSGLLGADSYTFTVTATNQVGSTTSSPSAAVKVLGPPVFSDPPQNVSANGGLFGHLNGDFGYAGTVYFSPPGSSGSYPVANYTIVAHDQTDPSAVVAPVTATSSPVYVEGLTAEHVYTFSVSANTFDGGNSTYVGRSATTNPVIMSATTPGPPVLTSAVTGPPAPGTSTGSIRLTWNDPVQNVVIDGYDVYVGTSPGAESTDPVNAQLIPNVPTFPGTVGGPNEPVTYDVPGLARDTTFYFTVRAVSSGTNSAPSNELAATTSAFDPPSAPTQANVAADDSSVTLYWAPPDSDGGTPITGYNVYVGTTPGGESSAPVNTSLLPADTTTYDVTGLTPRTPYYFTIRAANSGGLSPPTPELSSTPLSKPGAPTNVTATPGEGQVTVTWSPPTDDGGAAIQGYDVFVGTASGQESATAVNPSGSLRQDARSYTVTGLTNGTPYYFYVQAYTNQLRSPLIDEVSATPVILPGAPAAITDVDGGDRSVPVGSVIPNAWSFTVRDANGTAVPNVPVQLAVVTGTGTLSGGTTTAQVSSDAAGRVLVGGSVGASAGTVVFRASVSDTLSVQFTAHATRGGGLQGVSGNAQRVRVGAKPTAITVRLVNDSRVAVQGAPISMSVVQGPARFADGSTTATGNTDAFGQFSRRLALASAPGTTRFLVTVGGTTLLQEVYFVGDTAPTGNPDAYTVVARSGALAVPAANGVLANDVDPDGDSLAAVLRSRTAHGAVQLGRNGSFTYRPADGFTGTDSFTYVLTDGVLVAPVQTVTLTVDPASADIAVTRDVPASAARGSTFTLGVTVTNHGPSTTKAVVVSTTLPTGMTFGAVPSGVRLSNDQRTATYTVSNLADEASTSTALPVVVAATAKLGPLTLRTWAVAPVMPDADLDDNVASGQTVVTT